MVEIPKMQAAVEKLVTGNLLFSASSYKHRIVFLRNRQGAAIRVVGSLKDITDYKQNLITIQLQNEKLREIAWTQSHMARARLPV
ncbi:hypothetical protein [Dyadobacter bucti]|uniref:hypothetical protein n=1 Tax=Dyadobacter bucti TaxID=2572203 RepID=UPI003F70829A